ncbi:MAG: hypothetical protein JSV54_01320, partial [Chloroflexota bacterium]
MESMAPPLTPPLVPAVGSTQGAATHFDWEDVDDPSGVEYILQVGADAELTEIVVEKIGLADSEYTLTVEEQLEVRDAPYYWRVRAVDGAANNGRWTMSILFYVSTSQDATNNVVGGGFPWMWIMLAALASILLITGFLWLKSRKK